MGWPILGEWKVNKENALKLLYPSLSNADLQYSKLLVDPARISPLLKALTDENFALRQEVTLCHPTP